MSLQIEAQKQSFEKNEFEDYQEDIDLEIEQPEIKELTEEERLDLIEQSMQELIMIMMGGE